jgi:hypothetical protein
MPHLARALSVTALPLMLCLACEPTVSDDAGTAARDATTLDAQHDARAEGNDASTGIDAFRGADGSIPVEDAPSTADASAIADGSAADGSTSFDAFAGLDVFAAPDVFSMPDAFAAPDAFVVPDAFVRVDARASGGCISGATGTHVVRFRWEGSGAGSTAYVRYEANTLPDTSRWRVTANSRSIGYRPVFDDVFLGEGGLDLSGTGFIDVELSFSGLSSLSNVTLAIYGRSFSTGSSGSFEWQTFDGTGGSGLVANSAPYEWYDADATDAFTAGDDGILLRLYPGPPSGSLIVNRVELCITP